jgi:hypothetical protein
MYFLIGESDGMLSKNMSSFWLISIFQTGAVSTPAQYIGSILDQWSIHAKAIVRSRDEFGPDRVCEEMLFAALMQPEQMLYLL